MSPILERLRRRWRTIARFASIASGWTDLPALVLAGIAREGPFSGDGLYDRLGRILGEEVSPRLAPCGGCRVSLNLRSGADLMIAEEIFIENVYPLELLPFVPDVILDCGAHAGLFTIQSHSKYPSARLHAFEPEPENIRRLRSNLALNHIVCEVHPAAVGLSDGVGGFSGKGFGGHLARVADSQTIEVGVIGFPRYLRTMPDGKLLLKIDIEGAECELLPAIAGLLPRVTALFLETHHGEEECRRYLQPLLDAGFSHREIRRRHDSAARTDYVEQLLLRR